ncbi:MAG TPA: lipid-A-disaccharide synthase [Dissulfurispiraceae bacterium]|nr:lipid-A-disaccharide synthase [Dissulfurispiraceae bacterium]
MIIAGESSGELYGAYLAKAIRRISPEARIAGVGGDRMAAAGVELMSRISSSFGLVEAIRTYRELKKTFNKTVAALSTFKPQVLVLIDYPDFNLRLAAEARKRSVKVLYYVSPQVWAWRKGRINTISRLVDKMAVILPFEEGIYRETGLSCEFVGHPAMDEIGDVIGSEGFAASDIGSAELKTRFKARLGLDPKKPLITVMPGSRRHEISKLLPVLSSTIAGINEKYPDYQCVIPLAPNIDGSLFKSASIPPSCRLLRDSAIEALAASDAAIIASGTSTLQAALLQTPMVVVYKLSPLTFFIGKLIVNVKYIGLVNLLLENSVSDDSGLRMAELLQDSASAENIVAELTKIIDSRAYREDMAFQLVSVRKLYSDKRASARVAEMVHELCNVSSL